MNNSEAAYIPRGFIDVNKEKVGREIHDIPVWSEDEATLQKLGEFEVQEIIFAIPSMDAEKKKALYEYYKNAGYKLKVYDYPTMLSGALLCVLPVEFAAVQIAAVLHTVGVVFVVPAVALCDL